MFKLTNIFILDALKILNLDYLAPFHLTYQGNGLPAKGD